MKQTINVKGMHCKSCEMLIKDSLEDVNGVEVPSISHEKGTVEVTFNDNSDLSKIKKAIEEEGYEVL